MLVNVFFVSSTVEIIHLPKPVVNISLVSGGDLDENTTYYFIGWYNGEGTSPYYGQVMSPVSNMVNITTNSSYRSIKLDWGTLPSEVKGISFKWDNYSLMNSSSNKPYRWYSESSVIGQSSNVERIKGLRKWLNAYNSNGFT